MSLFSNLLRVGGFVAAPFTGGASIPVTQALAAGGDALGRAGQANASNRGVQIEANLAQEQLRQNQAQAEFNRQQQHEQNSADLMRNAYRDALRGDYVASGGYQGPATGTVNVLGVPRQLADYGFGPKPATAEQQALARQFGGDANTRLYQHGFLDPN